MNDTMNEITAFSPFGGRLVLEEVKGAQERANVPENSIETKAGDDRSMYVYVPASGCPDAKQTQVVMFLRDGADEASAQAAMQEYGLDALAEKEHFVLAFPNPRQSGWSERDAEDMDYLSRCFMALPQGKGKVGGFIGMIFYIGGSPSAGALLLAMSARRPLNVAGVLLSELPADYSIPQDGVNAPQVAYLCGGAARAADYFGKVNGVTGADARPLEHAVLYTSEALVQRHLWDISKAHGFYGPRLCGTRQRPGPRRERRLCPYLVRICTAPSARQQRKSAAGVLFSRHRLRAAVRRGAERLARYR